MAATNQDLQKLHDAVAQNLLNTIKQDTVDKIPTDAATLGAAIKFLKDNDIVCDPVSNSTLTDLRETLIKQREEQRRSRVQKVIQLTEEDLRLQ